MWWLAVPIAIGTFVTVKKIFFDSEEEISSNFQKTKSIFEENLEILKHHLIVSSNEENKNILFIGQPGAGKSSLIKSVTFSNCKPLPEVGVSTDTTNWSNKYLNYSFPVIKYRNFTIIDSPGYDTAQHPTGIFLNSFPFDRFDSIVIVFNNKLHSSDIQIMNRVAYLNKKTTIVRSYSENLSEIEINEIENDIKKSFNLFSQKNKVEFVSNRSKNGINNLSEYLFS